MVIGGPIESPLAAAVNPVQGITGGPVRSLTSLPGLVEVTGGRTVDIGDGTVDTGGRTVDTGGRTLDTGGRTVDTGDGTVDTGGRTVNTGGLMESIADRIGALVDSSTAVTWGPVEAIKTDEGSTAAAGLESADGFIAAIDGFSMGVEGIFFSI